MAKQLPLVKPEVSIRETMGIIDQHAKGIAIIVDDQHRLVATVTDGDIRRAILSGVNLEAPILQVKRGRHINPESPPITARLTTPDAELIALMKFHQVQQLPLLDEQERVSGLAVLRELLNQPEQPVTGVIMAGGFGNRLRPLTENMPKPMLPVNGRPLLEHTLDKLKHAGVRSVHVTTHYLGSAIVEHFKDGAEFGVHMQYIEESEPLGTAGALARLAHDKEPLLVLNGDILTGADLRAMLEFHREHHADLTVGVRQYDIEVPFGVVETVGVRVAGITEKPVLRQFINAGIYIVDPAVCGLIPAGHRFDMPDLIAASIREGKAVICFPVCEYWLDIGRMEQYQKAEADVVGGRV